MIVEFTQLKKRCDIEPFFERGKCRISVARGSCPIQLRFRSGVSGSVRVLIAVKRGVKNAVLRNRLRRRVREYFRLNRIALAGWDFCVVLPASSAELNFGELTQMLKDLLNSHNFMV